MTWFTDWWTALTLLQQSFAVVAIPATVILFLQTIALLFGLGSGHNGDADGDFADSVDTDLDGDFDCDFDCDSADDLDNADNLAESDPGLRLFTVRGIVAFFSVGGWLGIVLGGTTLHPALTITLAILGGLVALVVIALILKWSLSLQDSGNLDLRNAIGKTAQVYIPIPAGGNSSGKVTLVIQERYVELPAITQESTPLKTDQLVKITGIINQTTLVVKPIDS